MADLIKLRDVFKIDPIKSLTDLKKTDKHKLMDRLLNMQDASKRGLSLDFGLSNSGRRINNRIYPPKGQRAGISTWTEPYEKPIIRNHDSKEDPIGRIKEVVYQPLDAQAMTFFGHVSTFMAVKDALESDSPKRIYNSLKKHNLLTNPQWPGIGRLKGTALVSEQDAIEKFLDGRYLTFSAGTFTDRYTCGVCLSDWAQGDICDHRPGSITDEGELVVTIAGTFIGDEASVLSRPGNDLSQVFSMQLTDKMIEVHTNNRDFYLDPSTIYMTDCLLTPGEAMPTPIEKLQAMDARDLARQLFDGTLEVELRDALIGENHLETTWLVRIHDALHSEYDWRLRWDDDAKTKIPTDTFGLHAKLHELADSGEFRGSYLNGPLDKFDAAGKDSDAFVVSASEDNATEDDPKLEDGKAKEPEVEPIEGEVLEGYDLETAFKEVRDLISSEREALVDAIMAKITPPVKDENNGVQEAKETKDEKEIEDKVVPQEDGTQEPTDDNEGLKADYAKALENIQTLRDELDELKNQFASLDNSTPTPQNETESTNLNDEASPVEDPSQSNSEDLSGTKKLDDYHQNVVKHFKALRDERGGHAAYTYIYRKQAAGQLSRTFNINEHIQESE